MPTELIQLNPNFLAELKKVAPKKKRSKLWWLLPVFVIVLGAIALRPSWRTYVVTKARALIHREQAAPAASSPQPIVEAPVVPITASTVAPVVTSVPVATAPAIAPASTSAKPALTMTPMTPSKRRR